MQETAEEYRQRMYSHVDRNDPVKLQAAAPGKLAKLLKGVSAAKARKRPSPEQWSIAEIVAHLADTELVGGWRIRSILGAPETPIQGFDQDAWAAAMQYNKRDTRKSLEQFCALREANLALLKSLTPEQWKLRGIHSERGPETVETIVRMFAGHDLNHFSQIERILGEKSARKKI